MGVLEWFVEDVEEEGDEDRESSDDGTGFGVSESETGRETVNGLGLWLLELVSVEDILSIKNHDDDQKHTRWESDFRCCAAAVSNGNAPGSAGAMLLFIQSNNLTTLSLRLF